MRLHGRVRDLVLAMSRRSYTIIKIIHRGPRPSRSNGIVDTLAKLSSQDDIRKNPSIFW